MALLTLLTLLAMTERLVVGRRGVGAETVIGDLWMCSIAYCDQIDGIKSTYGHGFGRSRRSLRSV